MLTIDAKKHYHYKPPYDVGPGEQNILVVPGNSTTLWLIESIGKGPNMKWPGLVGDSVVLPLGTRITPLIGPQKGLTRVFKLMRGIPTMIPEYLIGAYAPLIDPGQEKY